MKVYFTMSMQEGCYYVRCMVPMIEAGWDGDKQSFQIPAYDQNQMAQACMNADVVVFHRPNDDRAIQIAEKLREQGKKIVMDTDDTYKDIDEHKFQYLLNRIESSMNKFAKQADLITCSTQFLADEWKTINPNVVVLPNCVDPDAWPEPLRNEGEKVRIGIVGSTAYQSDLEEFKPILEALSKRTDVQLVLFGLPPKNETTEKIVQPAHKKDYAFWESLNIEWQPLVPMAEYFDTLNELKLDLMLIPRADRYFNRCKSNLKFLEASMLEIPVIAQGFKTDDSPYQQNPEDKQFMIVVTENTDWEEAIDTLVKNKDLRKEIGKKAKEYVIANYSIADHINKWEKAYELLG